MERYQYKFDEKHLLYMKEQVWEASDNIDIYSDLSLHEFGQIQSYLGKPKSVLEVGCGLGRGSIFLNHLLNDDTVSYTLADRNGYTENTGSYMPEEDEFYNDIELTSDFCKLNGIKNLSTFDTENDDWLSLPKYDLIFSLCSFGMHVSIDRYMERLLSVSKPTTTMIFGVRGDINREEKISGYFLEKFSEHLIIDGNYVEVFPREDWFILKNPNV
jgi:SAM-dependent methyltransferase